MNELKRFDRPQLMIGIIGIASFINATIFFVIMFITASVEVVDGVIESITYNPILQSFYSIFLSMNLLCVVWFVIRLLTYRLRKKEADNL